MRTLTTTAGRVAAGAALAVVAALLGPAPTASSAGEAVTSFAATSDAGDYVGNGQTLAFTPANATFTIRGTAGSVSVSVDDGSALWSATFAAPASGQLSPGTFQSALRAPFNGSANGLSVSGAGRGCNQVKGFFDISAFSADNHGQVSVLDATFTQFCDSSPGALRGRVRYAAPADAPIVLTSANPVSVEGQPVVLSAKVLPGTSGVTFMDGATVLGTSSAANVGIAKWGIELPTVGTHSYTAVPNATTSTPVTSAPVTQVVRPGATSLTLRSGNSEYVGQGATAGFATPEAVVTTGGSASSGVTVSVSEGLERWTVTLGARTGQSLVVGSYAGAARFADATHPRLDVSGDGRGCNATTGSFTVAQLSFDGGGAVETLDATWTQYCDGSPRALTGRVRVGAGQVLASATSLAVTSAVGGQSTLTATVTGIGQTPAGRVLFTDATTGLALGNANLDGTGRATLTATLSRGAHSLVADYAGSARYAASQGSAALTVVGYPTSTTLSTTAKGTVKAGRPVSFGVTVTGGGPVPTGAVQLLEGAEPLGSAVLVNGAATVSWSPAARGTHPVTARYAGDATHEPSTSGPVTIRVS